MAAARRSFSTNGWPACGVPGDPVFAGHDGVSDPGAQLGDRSAAVPGAHSSGPRVVRPTVDPLAFRNTLGNADRHREAAVPLERWTGRRALVGVLCNDSSTTFHGRTTHA